jgi:enediyne biosynthesis protein E4
MHRCRLGKHLRAFWFIVLAAMGDLLAIGIAAAASPVFQDRTAALGLSLGTDSACWVDMDNDGWVDLVASGGVWRNNQGKGFTKIASVGPCVAADFDNDGYADLFCWASLSLYRNVGGKRFVDAPLPKLPKCVSRGACWGDFNGDGFVDLYIGGYEDWDADITYPSMILLNDRGKGFHLAWTEARFRTRGVTACDFNEDGRLDVDVSNYRLQPNQLWLGDGTGKFRDVAAEFGAVATSPGFAGGHSIGACWGDFDNDGHFDLFAGNFAHVDSRGDQPKSRFLKNLGPAGKFHFQDLGTCGVYYQESYATPAAGDYDNDGHLDLVFTTVSGVASFGRNNYPVLYRQERPYVFSDVTAAAGLARLPPTSQAAWADFNHDGSLDLVSGGKLFVSQGGGQGANHWLEVHLEGDGRRVNRSAIGAQVRLRLGEQTLSRHVEAGTGEGNQNDLTLHFGLGANAAPVTLSITWPDGTRQTVGPIASDRIIAVRYGK